MMLHGNARTCPKSRRLLVERIESGGEVVDGGGRGRWRRRPHRLSLVEALAGGRPAGPGRSQFAAPPLADQVAGREGRRAREAA